MLSQFVQIYSFVAEFNYPVASQGRFPVALPLEKALSISLEESDPIKLINRTQWMAYSARDQSCIPIDGSYSTIFTPLIETTYFRYITCTYLPLYGAAYIPKGTIWPPAPTAGDRVSEICRQAYGKPPLSVEEIESRYHFSPAEIENSTRIIWSKGQYDPTSGTEPAELPLSADRKKSRTLYAMDTAHREDLFRSNEKDREGVRLLRKQELEIIKGWLDPVNVF